MQLGCSLPVADIGTGPSVLRDYAQAAEGLGYAHLVAPNHVLGANPDTDHGDRRSAPLQTPITTRLYYSDFSPAALRPLASPSVC